MGNIDGIIVGIQEGKVVDWAVGIDDGFDGLDEG